MKKLLPLLAVIILSITLTGCGKYTFHDIYRYPCQDPANWESPDCKPPRCEAYGICTKDVMKGTPLYDEKTGQVNTDETP
jgi:hypothetical protein